MNEDKNSGDIFRLRSIQTAKVSEISEVTAASPVPVEDRVNFHIGNPVQDPRLTARYYTLVTGTEDDRDPGEKASGWTAADKPILNLIQQSITKSNPYMPRGGYLRSDPGKLITYFRNWLSEDQPEPLLYDFGESSGERECIIVSGGVFENLRVIFHTLNSYLIHQPAQILHFGIDIPDYLINFDHLDFINCGENEHHLLRNLTDSLNNVHSTPSFLLTGRPLSEINRREIRRLSLSYPLMIIEASDVPNHLSLAREAKMRSRVLRILSPAAFFSGEMSLSISFIAGNSDYIRLLENVHFELKGTPPAAEVELFSYLLENRRVKPMQSGQNDHSPETSLTSRISQRISHTSQLWNHYTDGLYQKTEILNRLHEKYGRKFQAINHTLIKNRSGFTALDDPFYGQEAPQVIHHLTDNPDNQESISVLTNSFLSAFLAHHPEYDAENSYACSGSSRTALSLLGYHCGIKNILTPDLSWTYHHCFPNVQTVPLAENLTLDVNEILTALEFRSDHWEDGSGAVVINNPHNASGKVFSEDDLSSLLKTVLQKRIFVIDDLSYQNVAPDDILSGPKSLKQLALDLQRNGYLNREDLSYLITVHSLSKTDCFAGARLSVVEINHSGLAQRFGHIMQNIKSNSMAILLAYLFYRNSPDQLQFFWTLRNRIMNERMTAMEDAARNLPRDRDPFHIEVVRPNGSMYPHLVVNQLPHGMSLDWLASGLARRGIGLVPLTTFSRTAKGYDLARKTFRLTLGGIAGKDELYRKTRRVLIDLNRLINEESARYNLNLYTPRVVKYVPEKYFPNAVSDWDLIQEKVCHLAEGAFHKQAGKIPGLTGDPDLPAKFNREFLPQRLEVLKTRYLDQVSIMSDALSEIHNGQQNKIITLLEQELYKENIDQRSQNFRKRLFDRTVHPTQSYSLKVDIFAEQLFRTILTSGRTSQPVLSQFAHELIDEFLGLNVPVRAVEEGYELVHDLQSVIRAEEYTRWHAQESISPYLLSFWGDWDGSTRPSGQGHLLVSSVLLENVKQLASLVKILLKYYPTAGIPADLRQEIATIDKRTLRFWQLLTNINKLTNQLEKRYHSVLPVNLRASRLRRFASRYKIARDPLKALWQHNDRLEKKMLDLRIQRRNSMEYYFSLNKRLRKILHQNLNHFSDLFQKDEFALYSALYRSPLRRFNLTPRIHQNMITSVDQFAIDTTVHNMLEINELAGRYGNPGMILALQISMSDKPEALIALDRKIRSRREDLLREQPDLQLPNIWLIPLFEDIDTVKELESYLNRLWEYCIQSRRIDQETSERFAEMVCEIFIAGSDLSQQVSQSTAAFLYREAKLKTIQWLAQKGLADKIRIKFGSGEPMQRQGGYYKSPSEKNPFVDSRNARQRMQLHLSPAVQKSTQYAKSPLQGILSSGDLRTYQSNVFEKIKAVNTRERARLLYHVKKYQEKYHNEINRISEPFLDTRLHFHERGYQEIERLSFGQRDPVYDEFTNIATQNFRRILYGSEEDVVGIHVISYFISRTTPTLRDRPTVRPTRELTADRSQEIIQRIAQTLPLAKHGTMLRAIGHNRAQSMILGINQLTTGLFRALNEFASHQTTYYDGLTLISDRILPNLPVQEILHSLRIYHESDLVYLNKMERAFPAGNSAFLYLRDDLDTMSQFIVLIQKEFLRRHGLNIGEFFEGENLKPELLPILDPEIAVLLQPDLFNTSREVLREQIGGKIDQKWLEEINPRLALPVKIRNWRAHIWRMIESPIFTQVSSFVELAQALNSLTAGKSQKPIALSINPSRVFRLGSNIATLLHGVRDDSMRQFLSSVVQYLTQLPESSEQVPINILRALEDVQTIIKIEEQALSKKEQDLLRFYILQMARLAGENG